MAAKPAKCTGKEQRAVIRLLWSEDVQEAKIHGRFLTQNKNSMQPKRTLYEWITKLKTCPTRVEY